MSYTKGPWGFVWQKGEYLIDAPMRTDIGIKIICSVTTRSAQEESKANARLIAAAPDLLEACESSLEYFYRLQSEGADGFDSVIEALEQAISKAEGKD